MTQEGLTSIINGGRLPIMNRNRVVIAAFCYSERSVPIINAVTKDLKY